MESDWLKLIFVNKMPDFGPKQFFASPVNLVICEFCVCTKMVSGACRAQYMWTKCDTKGYEILMVSIIYNLFGCSGRDVGI